MTHSIQPRSLPVVTGTENDNTPLLAAEAGQPESEDNLNHINSISGDLDALCDRLNKLNNVLNRRLTELRDISQANEENAK